MAVEGTNNFRDSYSPSLGAVISRSLGRHGAIYAQPIWINNTNPLPSELVDDNSTFIVGVGTRLRVRPTVYLVAEAAPRFGYTPDVAHVSFAIEKRAGGHSFPVELLERLRHDVRTGRARRRQQRQLVFGLQHLEEVLLMRSQRHG